MDSGEPTYVRTTIFKDRKSFEEWVASHPRATIATQRAPEIVYYEGTLVISSGE
jgi:heme-degrading monooxygenase HmoA